MSTFDLSVTFPSPGLIVLQSRFLFDDADSPNCRRFLERAFQADEVSQITIRGRRHGRAELRYCPQTTTVQRVVSRVVDCLRQDAKDDHITPALPPASTARDGRGVVRYYRHGTVVTGWALLREQPGRLELRNPSLHRKSTVCAAIERALSGVAGIDQVKASALTSTVHVDFDSRELASLQVIALLDAVLAQAEPTAGNRDLQLSLCTASLPVAAAAQLAFPPLLPIAAALFVYTAIPTFRKAGNVLVKERRLGVDALDAVVILGCLGTMSILPGAVLCWCASLGRTLVERTQERSRVVLLSTFGKPPSHAWLQRGGVEVQVTTERLRRDDIIVVNAGEVVPADGHVVGGLALIDQQTLTGETTPTEKGVGDRVFASTILVAGKVHVSVESSGAATAASQVGAILRETARYKLASQQRGERLADRAVIPTLALGGLGVATLGPVGGLAILKSDLGAGLRTAAPLALLNALALCAHGGILIKRGRALELMNEVDTILFDKTAVLAGERPEVVGVRTANGFTPEELLRLAATAERPFHHPMARAILDKAYELDLDLSEIDDVQYRVGHGVITQTDGHTVCVGNRRHMEREGISVPPEWDDALKEVDYEGRETVFVAVNQRLGGIIELESAARLEVRQIVTDLRRSGAKRFAIVSEAHEAATRRLAELFGLDQYFAHVPPQGKADCIARLQREGARVCFIGDGVKSSAAMQQADVSISLCGPASLTKDAADIVFLENDLRKLRVLRDVVRALERNVKRSRSLILAPNIACITGVLTMGFGIMASVVTNNAAALAALANGALPLRKVARLEAERRHRQELIQSYALDGDVDSRPAGPAIPAGAFSGHEEAEFRTVSGNPSSGPSSLSRAT